MPPIRRSNRVPKPRDYLDPSPPRRRQQSVFTIYTEPPENLSTQLSYQDLDSGSDLGFGSDLDDEDLSEHLSRQLYEGLGMDPPYQPQFLPKDRAGKPQNLPEDLDPVKLFQLFFTVKEIENIVKQTNQ